MKISFKESSNLQELLGGRNYTDLGSKRTENRLQSSTCGAQAEARVWTQRPLGTGGKMSWIGTRIVRNRHCLDALQSEIGKHGTCHISACIVCTWWEGEGIEHVVILRYSRLRQGPSSVTSRAKYPLIIPTSLHLCYLVRRTLESLRH